MRRKLRAVAVDSGGSGGGGGRGLLLAALARLSLKEPRNTKRMATDESSIAEQRADMLLTAQPSFAATWVTLWTNATFRHLLLYFSVQAIFAYGIITWLPAF